MAAALVSFSSLLGCGFLRTKGVLQELNAPGAPPAPGNDPPVVTMAMRVGRLSKAHLADSYMDPKTVAAWLTALGEKPEPLTNLARCLVDAKRAGFVGPKNPITCDRDFMKAASASLPSVPTTIDPLKGDLEAPVVAAELDAERFLANARSLGSSLASLEELVGRGPLESTDLANGIAEGTRRAAAYVKARSWHRSVKRPTTAIVMSGGGSTGAFSAGLIWRLLEVLRECHAASGGGCPDARIDLAAGTSTGALISTVVDVAGTPGDETKARDLLVDAYTCSVNSRLYCVQDEWIWKLATSDLKGLARFDGIREMLRTKVPEGAVKNQTELVAVSVDFESGDIYGVSDVDPEDAGDADHRADAILASIVEPVLAQPIQEIPRDGGKQRGTFLDGGVRSGLPLLEAVRRGAERVLIVNTGGIEPGRAPPQKNAFKILMRTIDLLSGQPRPAELQQGELAALERRMVEYNVCRDRLGLLAAQSAIDVEGFCRRTRFFPPQEAPEAAAPAFMGPGYFQQVAKSWRTSWVFRPEVEIATTESYAFNPAVMRGLFELGAKTFQRRCTELLDLLAIEGVVASASCSLSEDDVVARARALYKPLGECGADKVDEIRTCQ